MIRARKQYSEDYKRLVLNFLFDQEEQLFLIPFSFQISIRPLASMFYLRVLLSFRIILVACLTVLLIIIQFFLISDDTFEEGRVMITCQGKIGNVRVHEYRNTTQQPCFSQPTWPKAKSHLQTLYNDYETSNSLELFTHFYFPYVIFPPLSS